MFRIQFGRAASGVRQTGNPVSLWRKFCRRKQHRNSPHRHPGREVSMPQRTEIAPLVIPANAGIQELPHPVATRLDTGVRRCDEAWVTTSLLPQLSIESLNETPQPATHSGNPCIFATANCPGATHRGRLSLAAEKRSYGQPIHRPSSPRKPPNEPFLPKSRLRKSRE